MYNFQCRTLSDFADSALSPLDDIVSYTNDIETYCRDINAEGCDNDVISGALYDIDTTLRQIRDAVELIKERF